MSNNSPLSEFEKSAYKFIEELKNISIEIPLLPIDERKKANSIVFCVKSIMSCVKRDIEEIEQDKIKS